LFLAPIVQKKNEGKRGGTIHFSVQILSEEYIKLATGTVTGRNALFVVPGIRPTINASNSLTTLVTFFSSDTAAIGLNLNLNNNTLGDLWGVVLGTTGSSLLNNTVTVFNTNPGFVWEAVGLWQNFNQNGIITGNSFTVATVNPAATLIGMDVDPFANVLINNNSFVAPIAVRINNAVGIAAGSTGNIRNGGTCNVTGVGATGQIFFTDGTTCP